MDLIIQPFDEESDIIKNVFSQKEKNITGDKFLNLFNDGHFKDITIHEILEKCELHFHIPQPKPRSAELEERISKLKAEQANAEYRAMTRNLEPRGHESESLRQDIRSVSSHVAVIINFVFAVVGSFFFGFKAVEYALPEKNIPGQVLMGIITSTVVAIADLFFILRTI